MAETKDEYRDNLFIRALLRLAYPDVNMRTVKLAAIPNHLSTIRFPDDTEYRLDKFALMTHKRQASVWVAYIPDENIIVYNRIYHRCRDFLFEHIGH